MLLITASGLRSSCASMPRNSSFSRSASCASRYSRALSMARATRCARSSASRSSADRSGARTPGHEGDHAQQTSAGDYRDAHGRARREGAHDPQVLGTPADFRQGGFGDLGVQHRSGRCAYRRHRLLAVWVGRVIDQLSHQFLFLGVRVRR